MQHLLPFSIAPLNRLVLQYDGDTHMNDKTKHLFGNVMSEFKDVLVKLQIDGFGPECDSLSILVFVITKHPVRNRWIVTPVMFCSRFMNLLNRQRDVMVLELSWNTLRDVRDALKQLRKRCVVFSKLPPKSRYFRDMFPDVREWSMY